MLRTVASAGRAASLMTPKRKAEQRTYTSYGERPHLGMSAVLYGPNLTDFLGELPFCDTFRTVL